MTITDALAAQKSAPEAPIDKAALIARYVAERGKRLRPDGNAQYLEVKGRLAHYLDDPYTPSRRARR